MLSLTMRDGVITAVLATIGFATPLGVAWYQGAFEVDDNRPVANAAVVFARAAPVRTAAIPETPASNDPPTTSEHLPMPSDDPPPQLDSNLPVPDDGAFADPIAAEARETIRANRRH